MVRRLVALVAPADRMEHDLALGDLQPPRDLLPGGTDLNPRALSELGRRDGLTQNVHDEVRDRQHEA